MKTVLLGFAAAAGLASTASAATLFQSPVGDIGTNVITGVLPSFVAVTALPEPGTWAMMLVGVGGLGAMLRSRRKSAGAGALA